jgi:hypothetical protein
MSESMQAQSETAKNDFLALAGLWEGRNIDPASLRHKAWPEQNPRTFTASSLGDKPMSEYHVATLWDDKAKVWVGTSEDVPGLCVEAATIEELLQTAGELIPELLILNGVLPQGDTNPVPFRVTVERMARKSEGTINSISLCE